MSKPVPRRQRTSDEAIACKLLDHVGMPVASFDKRFRRSIQSTDTITDNEAPQVWRLLIRYRRQWSHPERARLLALAEKLSAPDLRKQAAAAREQAEIDELKRKYTEAMR